MNKFYISSFSVSPWSEVGATGEVETIKVYFPKLTVTSNNNKINNVLFFSYEFILLIISHRLTFMQKIDKIICLSDGSIKEIGIHDDLICQNGCYKKMYDLNSSKYK